MEDHALAKLLQGLRQQVTWPCPPPNLIPEYALAPDNKLSLEEYLAGTTISQKPETIKPF